MFFNAVARILPPIARIGVAPSDSDELRLQKNLMVAGSFMFILAGALWGVIYFILAQPVAGLIPLSYAAVSLFSIILFGLTRRYRLFRISQLVLILLLPFLLQLALGGFVNSSAVILWSILSPLGALLFASPRHAPYWFVAYLGLVVLSGFLQPATPMVGSLSPRLVTAFFVMNIAAVSTIVFVLIYYFVGQRNIFQEKSDKLLLNILPEGIAAILKNERRTIADYHAEATILFADVADFTPLSAGMAPVELVELLNEVFSDFDALVEKYGLEKIKTIGDCYMVAAGVPHPRPDHAHVLARMALEMRDHVNRRHFGGRQLAFRIGINSGPVVAGVIGHKKFIYDLWGDTVNTASRMESHGLAGQVQVTETTYQRLRHDFCFEERGVVHIKGKGEMKVYLLQEAQRTMPGPHG
ncbi:MAG: adenylate/guanylate cyclase domain-containing protein [Chloroflexi bacterium]|nr:adenylate/guanylate cyclase domain-containing protein [Chloroflexota bacterium]MCI0579142.1 adenylate/guanylate cyclase domain-containing protein [Chloroflexota bacterium]MCI0643359.1 adenylate/guanylate cyclase domain-containing protein [Chloroflexota bacterium]MCI0728338.1 adenylate/guanylate cyclase domain-containing protein [Chloroflexota bacterium]